jgi:hypothetical protein
MLPKAYAAGDKGASRGEGKTFLARSGDRLEGSRAWRGARLRPVVLNSGKLRRAALQVGSYIGI